MPVAGSGPLPRLALYHQGNLPGRTAAAYLFPEPLTAVVILSNTFGLTDGPDWIAQLLIEALFEDTTNADYLALAHEAIQGTSKMVTRVEEELLSLRNPGEFPGNIISLCGRYYNPTGTTFLYISAK